MTLKTFYNKLLTLIFVSTAVINFTGFFNLDVPKAAYLVNGSLAIGAFVVFWMPTSNE